MDDKKIVLAFSGSLRKESLSTKVLHAFGERAPSNIDFRVADISKLPLYNQDDELPEPDFLLELKAQLKPAHGILLVTPEYNRSIPPVLKNALDWVSRPQYPPGHGPWAGKATAIAGVSPYSLGAVGAVFHLRQVLTFLNMPAMQQPEFYLTFAGEKFDDNGNLTDQTTMEHIDGFWAAFVNFIDRSYFEV
ncbi:MAG TPA: NAD(P)H-dependent oxidoreductase [Candidatus Saccharimonadales bacterium]